ncbi:MAG: spondin domain-containing protein [Acidimicrobiales bacterium]
MPNLITRRARWAAAAAAALAMVGAAAPAGAGGRYDEPRTYQVTVKSITAHQPFTPPVIVLHERGARLFKAGRPASVGVREIAENGNLDPLLAALDAHPAVADVAVAAAGDPPPVQPGESATVMVTGDRWVRRLSLVAMLICTNDGFAGLDGIAAPRQVGQTRVAYADAYDAGSERNTERFADLVPPCGPLTGVDSGGQGTGMSNPALAEGGVVRHHEGIDGSADLTGDHHGWATDRPVLRIEITRVS